MNLQPEPQPYQTNQGHAKITPRTQPVASSNDTGTSRPSSGNPGVNNTLPPTCPIGDLGHRARRIHHHLRGFPLVFRGKRPTLVRHGLPLFRTRTLVGSLSGRSGALTHRSVLLTGQATAAVEQSLLVSNDTLNATPYRPGSDTPTCEHGRLQRKAQPIYRHVALSLIKDRRGRGRAVSMNGDATPLRCNCHTKRDRYIEQRLQYSPQPR
jgi:hypothetical protein